MRHSREGGVSNPDKLHILVAESNDHDIKHLECVARDCEVNCELYFVRDGEEALDALAQRAGFEAMPHPDLILMNPYLPKINGLEVLRQAKGDVRVRRIPVIVFTLSERPEDLVRAYDCGAASYMLKPVDPEQFGQLTQTVRDYWRVARRHPDPGPRGEVP